MHTHAYTDTAVWAHLFLWRSELIPAWGHRPHAHYKLYTQPFSSPPSLFFLFSSFPLFSLSNPPVFSVFISLCHSLLPNLSLNYPSRAVLLCSPALFFHSTLWFLFSHILTKVNVFKLCTVRLAWGIYFPKGYMFIILNTGYPIL